MSATIDWREVEQLARDAEVAGGVVGVAAIAPGGERYARNGDRAFRAASTVKIPIMIEICRQIDRGERALADPRTITAADRTPGSGVLLHLHDGLQLTLADLLYLMISISDNEATNILIDLAGMDAVNATMWALGMEHSALGRRMTGVPAAEGMPFEYSATISSARRRRSRSSTLCGTRQERATGSPVVGEEKVICSWRVGSCRRS